VVCAAIPAIRGEIIMKITCKQTDLNRGLSIVSHAVSSRSTLPILANILLTTENGCLKLSATNLEMGISHLIDADILEEGATTIPAKTFIDLVNSLRQGEVTLTIEAESFDMNIKSPGSNANIKGMDPTEYPLLPTVEGSESPISFDAAVLKEIIAQSSIAAATDDSRPVLTGIHVESLDGNEVAFSAADAFRLTHTIMQFPEVESEIPAIIIPVKTMQELARILPSDGDVQMFVTTNRSQVLFHTKDVDLVSRLIEGTFPNIKAAIPKEYTTRVVVETKEFLAAVKTVMPFARDSSNITRIKVRNANDEASQSATVTLESTAEDVGNNITTINATVNGPDQEIIFNVKYLTDVLNVLDTPEVALEIINAAKPGVIKPVDASSYTYIIMPMSTNR
jgi:DNA polymerase III subunit beta